MKAVLWLLLLCIVMGLPSPIGALRKSMGKAKKAMKRLRGKHGRHASGSKLELDGWPCCQICIDSDMPQLHGVPIHTNKALGCCPMCPFEQGASLLAVAEDDEPGIPHPPCCPFPKPANQIEEVDDKRVECRLCEKEKSKD